MALKLPPNLKLSQLKSLAFQCGILTSGTKEVLSTRLQHEIVPLITPSNGNASAFEKRNSNHIGKNAVRILSIDMGIRNLAYCLVHLPESFPSPSPSSALPRIEAWHRTAVSSPPPAPSKPSKADKSAIKEQEKEQFTPSSLSAIAYNLLKTTLLPLQPTHILIERQRFRSMGSSHILEWTIRVNMFEAMLYAILHALKAEGIWHGTVIPILPGKVGGYWLPEKLDQEGISAEKANDAESETKKSGKKRTTKNAKLLNKGAKIDLVRSWLEDPQLSPVVLGTEQAKSAGERFLEAWNRKPGGRKGRVKTKEDELVAKGETLGKAGEGAAGTSSKLDDLADSLLQGMAWVRWEENKRKVLEDGVEGLDLSIEPRTLQGA